MKNVLLCAIALLFCGAVLTSSQTVKNYLLPKSANNRQFPKVKRSINGTVVLTYVEQMGTMATIYVVISKDSGLTWSQPRSPGMVVFASIGLQRQPYAIADNQGVLHCIWEGSKSGDVQRIRYSRSTDDGATWSVPALVDTTTTNAQDFSSIACDATGNLYVSFINGNLPLPDGYEHIFMVRSTNAGVSWEPRTRVDQFIAGGSCECCQQNIAVSQTGEIAVAFRSNISNRRDIFVARSTDQGETFDEPTLVQNEKWMINACPATGPNLSYDKNGDLHIAWRDTRNSVGKNVAYYALVPRGGRIIPKNVSLNNGFSESAEYPVPAVFSDNPAEVIVAFETSRGVAYASSKDGGTSFKTQLLDESVIRLSSVSAVFVGAGKPLILWQTDRDGKTDIAVARPMDFTTAVDEQAIAGMFDVNVYQGRVVVSSTGEPISQLRLYSIDGKLLGTSSGREHSLDLEVHTTGAAVLTIVTVDGAEYQKVLVF